jgi:Domain of unknown function (DUF4279)
MTIEARSHLTIRSSRLTADELVARAGLTPDELWNRGDGRDGRSDRTHNWSGISYRSSGQGPRAGDECLRNLVSRLEPHAASIAQLGAEVEAEGGPGRRYSLVVEVHTDDINADVEVHRDDLQALDQLRAWVAVHVWFTRPPDRHSPH